MSEIAVVLAVRCACALATFAGVRDPKGSMEPVVWGSNEIPVVIQRDGTDDVDDGSDVAAIRAALAVWSTPSCTSLRLIDDGLVAQGDDANDGKNRVFYREVNWPGAANGAGALTTRRRDTSSTPEKWIDADISINGVEFSWATDGRLDRYDVQSVVTHELGHLIGLQHSAVPEATLYFGNRRGLTHIRTLHPDDIAGVCYLYPKTQPRRCQSEDECPLLQAYYGGGDDLRLVCAPGSGTCIAGLGRYGAACSSDADCASRLCLLDPSNGNAADPGYCSSSCIPGNSCASGDFCKDVGNGGRCWVGRDDCLTDDDCPGANNVCLVDLDGRRRCTLLCLEDVHCRTIAGAICHGGTGTNPPGFCRVPGTREPGQQCENGLECQSLVCAGAGVMPSCLAPTSAREDGGVGDGSEEHDATDRGEEAPTSMKAADGPTGSCACGASRLGATSPWSASARAAVLFSSGPVLWLVWLLLRRRR